MKNQLLLCLAVCALLSGCATTKTDKEAMSRAQLDIQNAESSLAAARNSGAEIYAVVNMSSARTQLQMAKNELGNRKYDRASFSAQSSLDFSRNAAGEIETAKKLEAEAKLRQAEEARRKAAAEEQVKVKAAVSPRTPKPGIKLKSARPAAKINPAQQEPAAQRKEEPKKKSWWSW